MKDYKPFQFKQFSIHQNHAAMKVGTDSIMLGSWASVNKNDRILDIGTGTGILSIMLAQKVNGNCVIDAIEIDDEAIKDAQHNIENSPWHDSIQLIKGDFKMFEAKEPYDVIICNPPFHTGNISPKQARATARSTQLKLSLESLLKRSSQLLKDRGRLYLIIPYDLKNKIINEATNLKLYIGSVVNIFPNQYKPANRVLFEFFNGDNSGNIDSKDLIINTAQNEYSKAYKSLTKAFYLNH